MKRGESREGEKGERRGGRGRGRGKRTNDVKRRHMVGGEERGRSRGGGGRGRGTRRGRGTNTRT